MKLDITGAFITKLASELTLPDASMLTAVKFDRGPSERR